MRTSSPDIRWRTPWATPLFSNPFWSQLLPSLRSIIVRYHFLFSFQFLISLQYPIYPSVFFFIYFFNSSILFPRELLFYFTSVYSLPRGGLRIVWFASYHTETTPVSSETFNEFVVEEAGFSSAKGMLRHIGPSQSSPKPDRWGRNFSKAILNFVFSNMGDPAGGVRRCLLNTQYPQIFAQDPLPRQGDFLEGEPTQSDNH